MIVEHQYLHDLAARYPRYIRMRPLAEIRTADGPEPIYELSIYDHEKTSDNLPVLGLFAGVHGIEAIGVRILVSFVEYLAARITWNRQLQQLLTKVRIAGIPIINPSGFVLQSRCNANGVDLMRNAPVESDVQTPIIGGQRLSRHLPYYRGSGDMEPEVKCVVEWVRQNLHTAPFALALDIHSGFGWGDFLWTPYAARQDFPPQWASYDRLRQVIETALPNHMYKFEPQWKSYRTAGDLWDFLTDEHQRQSIGSKGLFLPLTLEIGSWRWIRKSPKLQIGAWDFFNPLPPHRRHRVLRHHAPLLALLLEVAANHDIAVSTHHTD